MPLNIQPYPRPLPTLPIQDTVCLRGRKVALKYHLLKPLVMIWRTQYHLWWSEEPLGKPLTAPHSSLHSPSHSGTYSFHTCLLTDPLNIIRNTPPPPLRHIQNHTPLPPRQLLFRGTFRDHESLCRLGRTWTIRDFDLHRRTRDTHAVQQRTRDTPDCRRKVSQMWRVLHHERTQDACRWMSTHGWDGDRDHECRL